MSRWLRLFWPELVLASCWVTLVALGRTLFTDDDTWPHMILHVMQWVVVVGYAGAAVREHLRPAAASRTAR